MTGFYEWTAPRGAKARNPGRCDDHRRSLPIAPRDAMPTRARPTVVVDFGRRSGRLTQRTQSLRPEEILGELNEVERKNAPVVLYFLGHASHFDCGARASVVGTRKPTELGLRRTVAVVRELVARNFVVVSGLAEGVDACAHQAAIDANGKTIAVVGSGVDRPFPSSNRSLWDRIAADHLLVSQFSPGTPPIRTNFPRRNRTMALLTDATIIVEAGEGSGTLHQGWEALRLGRRLYVLEALTKQTELRWPAEMIKYGAEVLTRENFGATLEDLPVRPRAEPTF
jgi:DNA processing protein